MVMLNKKNAEKINPATEEKQDEIIAALGGVASSDNSNIDDLIEVVETEVRALKEKLTDHSQLTQVVKADGTPVDFVSEFTALKAKLADASSKTQIVSDTGANLLPAGKPILLTGTVTLPADASSYAANDAVNNSASAPVAMAFDVDAAIANGGGGLIGLVKIEAPSQFAGKTINLVVYKDTPSNIPNDNTVFTLTTGNSTKRVAIIPILMDAQIGASTICFGQASVMIPYQTIASAKTLKGLLFVSDAVTSPTQSGVITVAVTTIQLN
jgi:hypothetical protein